MLGVNLTKSRVIVSLLELQRVVFAKIMLVIVYCDSDKLTMWTKAYSCDALIRFLLVCNHE